VTTTLLHAGIAKQFFFLGAWNTEYSGIMRLSLLEY